MTRRYGKPGEKYGLLTILEEAEAYRPSYGGTRRRVVCQCGCGNTTVVQLPAIRSGNTSSCGCRQGSVTHGLSGGPTWQSWRAMCKRCLDPQNKDYHSYGGRGIAICQRWLNSFEAFLEDMGERPEGLTLERIDNNGNYEPANCCWATRLEQGRNKRVNHYLTHNGETLCMTEWEDRTGVPHWTIRYRLKKGWTVVDALTTPPDVRTGVEK